MTVLHYSTTVVLLTRMASGPCTGKERSNWLMDTYECTGVQYVQVPVRDAKIPQPQGYLSNKCERTYPNLEGGIVSKPLDGDIGC